MTRPHYAQEWERDPELEADLEGSLESEFEDEGEFEEEGEFEDEGEFEEEGEFEDEGEFEAEYDMEYELEDEADLEQEEFFRRLRGVARGVGKLVRRAAPILRTVARVAAPAVLTAVGGPLGGALGGVATRALGEGEFEDEVDGEFEDEVGAVPVAPQAALLAELAARAPSEGEAEAMIGAASVAALSPRDRAALRAVLPYLVRGTAVLTRILRRRGATRPVVRAVPTIVSRTAVVLRRRAAAGRPVTRPAAARVMASQTRRVLAQPNNCARAVLKNVQSAVRAPRPAARRRRFHP